MSSNAHLLRFSSPRAIPTYYPVRLHAPALERLAPETFYLRPEKRFLSPAGLRSTTLARLRVPVSSTGGETVVHRPSEAVVRTEGGRPWFSRLTSPLSPLPSFSVRGLR